MKTNTILSVIMTVLGTTGISISIQFPSYKLNPQLLAISIIAFMCAAMYELKAHIDRKNN